MTYRILILSNDPSETKALVDVLNNTENEAFDIDIATHLAVGLEKLQTKNADAILVDLPLADSSGMSTFDRLFSAAPHTPIIALSAKNDEAVAMQAVERGAQATLTKGALECTLVPEVVRNIIMRRNIDEASYREKARAEIALNSISDAVLCTDIAGNIDYLNTAAEAITGWSREEARGMSISVVFKLINGITREPAKNPVELVLQKNAPMVLNADTVLVRKDGSEASIEDSASPIHDEDGKLMGVVIVFHDVSASYAIKTKMAHLAQHDALTNLPNRVLLNDRIAQAITHAKRRGTKLAVLFLDLDHFKHINDSLGHETGDKLLQSVTQRLNSCVRSSDTVSRQGGDEFVILLAEGSHEQDAALTADKIIALLNLPHFIAKQELYVTTSVGISVYPADGKDPATLIKNADTAMYHAKDKGRDNYQFFRADMNTRAVERQFMEADLRRAIENKELVLYYQPKINLVNGKIAGAEALLRWMHNDWGMLSPERFIPIAEESGLIVPIGQWVLREACTQAKRWSDAGCAPISIAVNISALEFRQENFFENVRAILYATGLDAHCLQSEIP